MKKIAVSNRELNGILVVNKPSGITSRDVVNILSKKVGIKKCGHTGTLDPLANGVLVCTIGKCTKLDEFLTSEYKTYKTILELGYETDTLDVTGKTLHESNINIYKDDIISVIKGFIGTYSQEVPIYSAVKINGKKLYEYARSGQEVDLPSRDVTIKEISEIEVDGKTVSFTCTVSKGTYIRSLIRDIGRKLGTYATMKELTRTSQGKYSIEESYSLESIENGEFSIIEPEEIFKDLYTIECDGEKYKQVVNGVKQHIEVDSEYVVFTYDEKVIALYIKSVKYEFRMHILF